MHWRPLNLVRANLQRLSQRFPPGLKYLVNYDTTTFVRDTVHDVLITLFIAFGLVGLVVFLFLGSVRATVIPTIAVPVSVIGTFAVLLAAGYSANTVSLLAMVLAIGILVDDAIVVVENVERVMGENPDFSPAQAAKQAMTEITAPIIAITLVLLLVFVPIAFIPGVSGTLFRQFAVTISVAMLISAINALTLSPALCAVFLRHRGPKRGPMGMDIAAYRRGSRRLCGNRAPPRARIVARGRADCGVCRRPVRSVLAHADRLPAGRGPGCLLCFDATAGRRLSLSHQRGGAPHRGAAEIDAAAPQCVFDSRLFDHRWRQRPNAAFIVATLKPFADRVGEATRHRR